MLLVDLTGMPLVGCISKKHTLLFVHCYTDMIKVWQVLWQWYDCFVLHVLLQCYLLRLLQVGFQLSDILKGRTVILPYLHRYMGGPCDIWSSLLSQVSFRAASWFWRSVNSVFSLWTTATSATVFLFCMVILFH